MKILALLVIAVPIINTTNAFAFDGKLHNIVSVSNNSPCHDTKPRFHFWLKPCFALQSSIAPNETTEITVSKSDEGVIKNTVFPTPKPISDKELYTQGLPILVEASEHAKTGRTMCTELPENGCVIVSYRTVLQDSTKISRYIISVMKKDNYTVGDFVKPRTVAHLCEPGSEYLASMWGVSIMFTRLTHYLYLF